MINYFCMYPRDVNFDLIVLLKDDPDDFRRVRPEYRDLACPGCGKIDERKAIERGVSHEIEFSTARDIIPSWDHCLLVSLRMREILETVAPGDIAYFAIPKVTDFFIAVPNHMFPPIPGASVFTIHYVCTDCGRPKEANWRPGPLKIDADVRIGAFALESSRFWMPAWFVSQEVAAALKSTRPKLRGLLLLDESLTSG